MKSGLTISPSVPMSGESSRFTDRSAVSDPRGMRITAANDRDNESELRCGACARRRLLRRARHRQRCLRASRRPSSAEQRGRAGRARDEDDAPGVQLREGAGRHPGGVRRGRLARDPRRGRHAQLARHRRPAPRRGADERGAVRDPLARGARRRVHARRTAAIAAGPLRRRERGKRLLQVGDRTGHAITKALREAFEEGAGAELPAPRARTLEPSAGGWAASFETKDGACRDRGRRRRSRRRRPLLSPRPRRAASCRRTIRTRQAR